MVVWAATRAVLVAKSTPISQGGTVKVTEDVDSEQDRQHEVGEDEEQVGRHEEKKWTVGEYLTISVPRASLTVVGWDRLGVGSRLVEDREDLQEAVSIPATRYTNLLLHHRR